MSIIIIIIPYISLKIFILQLVFSWKREILFQEIFSNVVDTFIDYLFFKIKLISKK